MEPQDNVFVYDKKEEQKCSKKNCLGIVAIILAIAFTFVIGLLVGAALALVILLSLPAIIVLAIILGLLLILTIILIICNRKKEKNVNVTKKVGQKGAPFLTNFLNIFLNFIPDTIHINLPFRRKRESRNISNRIKRFL